MRAEVMRVTVYRHRRSGSRRSNARGRRPRRPARSRRSTRGRRRAVRVDVELADPSRCRAWTCVSDALGLARPPRQPRAGVGVPAGRTARRTAPTLDRIQALIELLGSPELEFPAVHITGTNGKTSAARMTTALLDVVGPLGRLVHEPVPGADQRAHGAGTASRSPTTSSTAARRRRRRRASSCADRPSYFEILTAAALRLVRRRRGRRRRGRGRARRHLGRHEHRRRPGRGRDERGDRPRRVPRARPGRRSRGEGRAS